MRRIGPSTLCLSLFLLPSACGEGAPTQLEAQHSEATLGPVRVISTGSHGRDKASLGRGSNPLVPSTPAPPARQQGDLREGAPTSPPANPAGTRPAVTLEIHVTPNAIKRSRGSLLIYAFRPTELDSLGLPHKTSQAALHWASPTLPFNWPITLEIDPPTHEALVLFAAVDRDGNGRLGPGDRLGHLELASTTAAAASGGPLHILLDQDLPEPGDGEGTR